ncbi:hypothetical protein ABZV91_02035 [Nocardia sp. NPDC004568]|uniref:hypothetical protein n=1 Tax=Nocardia sp. NPDC004568 TaxID=3154551 RepID=UPI0033A80F96
MIAKYETGLRPVDSRRTLLALAGALGCTLADLTGGDDRIDPSTSMFHRWVADIETALWTQGNVTDTRVPRTLDELAAAPAGHSSARNRTFGAANVALWRMSSAVERREPGEALRIGETLNPTALPNGVRHAQFFVELGRAHAMKRDHRAALHALLRGEHAAPQHVRGMAPVRELVGSMLRKAQRDLTTGELGRLAQRVGVVP